MGMHWFWKCNVCGYEIATNSLLEFYRDKNGHRKPYGRHAPMSKMAKIMGVKGFTSNAYCPECHTLREVIVKEFEKPVIGGGHWRSKQPAVEYETLCPKCGTELKQRLDESDICPECSKGKFEAISFKWS